MDAEVEKLKTQIEAYLTRRLGGEATISSMKSLSGGGLPGQLSGRPESRRRR